MGLFPKKKVQFECALSPAQVIERLAAASRPAPTTNPVFERWPKSPLLGSASAEGFCLYPNQPGSHTEPVFVGKVIASGTGSRVVGSVGVPPTVQGMWLFAGVMFGLVGGLCALAERTFLLMPAMVVASWGLMALSVFGESASSSVRRVLE